MSMLGRPLESHRTSSSPVMLSKYMTAIAGRPEVPMPGGDEGLVRKKVSPAMTTAAAAAQSPGPEAPLAAAGGEQAARPRTRDQAPQIAASSDDGRTLSR